MFHLISFTYLALGGFSFSHGYIFEMLSFCHGRNSLMCGVYCKTDKSRSRFCINQSFHHKDTKFVAAVKHRIAVGSICHIFVVDSPNRRGNVNVIILLSVSFTFLAHRVESSVSLWGDFSTAFGEGPEQGSAGTSWGSRTSSTPSRESFSGALPPFVTDGDGWLGRPRGTCKIMYDIQCYMI